MNVNHFPSISYDDLGNPRLTQFNTGAQVEYVYTPTGQKVREIHRSPKGLVVGGTLPSPHEMTADTTDYIGPAIYRDGKPEMVRYAGGFASLSKSGSKYIPAFHHYITDYLGNNRAVVRASDGAFVQVTHYYPWGSVYGVMGTGAALQPYKYGDKELDLTAGVARYDYAARAYFPAIPRFDRPDALAGKYPHISPYAFCANNPVNIIDPTGNMLIFNNATDDDLKYIIVQLQSVFNSDIILSYDSDHKVIIESGAENIGHLHSKSVDKKIADIITSDIVTSINIANDSEVLIGEISTETIDLSDIDKVRQDELTPAAILVHEIVENYEKAKYKYENSTPSVPNKELTRMHFNATKIENQVTGVPTSGIRNSNLEEGFMTVEKLVGEPIIIKFDPKTRNIIRKE